MPEKYLLFPMSVLDLCYEMRKAVDDYKARRINSAELQELVQTWAHNVPEKLFDGEDYKITVKKVVGARRMAIVSKMLEGYQTHL